VRRQAQDWSLVVLDTKSLWVEFAATRTRRQSEPHAGGHLHV